MAKAKVHRELAPAAACLPRVSLSPWKLALLRRFMRLRGVPRIPKRAGVTIRDVSVPGWGDDPSVRIRLYRPASATGAVPVLVWIHGGGYVMGTAQLDQRSNIDLVRTLGIAVASVEYRLAPEHPFPAALDDCYAALWWVHHEAKTWGLRADRIAVGGASAGGGLAAALAQLALDRGEVSVRFQLLIYPMLDDRTVLRTELESLPVRIWTAQSNALGWKSYLGGVSGAPPVYAVPARREEVAGLPSAWVGVGTLDLFHDEAVAYAERLMAAGVECELEVVPGAYHGFDVVSPRAKVTRSFRASYVAALRRALRN